jgi:DNA-3-methyladenine glycosylase II
MTKLLREQHRSVLREQHRSVLATTPPYSLSRTLRALTGFTPCAGDQSIADGRVRKALLRPGAHPDEAVVVEVAPPPDGQPGVNLTVYAGTPLEPGEVAGVRRSVGRWLGLDDDLGAFLAVARADPAMAQVLTVTTGLHQVRFPSLAEGAAYFALTQRSTQWFAAARKRRIVSELGARGELDGEVHIAFPSLATLGALGEDELVGFAGNRQRAVRLREVLTGIAALDEEWLRTAPFAEARAALLAVRGVGAFTADAILLRVLGRPDNVPLEMAQFTRVVEALYGDPAPTAAQLRERYGHHIGWWAYLSRMGLGWLAADAKRQAAGTGEQDRTGEQSGSGQECDAVATRSSHRTSVRTPQPVAPLASSPSGESAQAGEDMSRCAQRSRNSPANSRRYIAAITEPAPTCVELTRSATSLSSASR